MMKNNNKFDLSEFDSILNMISSDANSIIIPDKLKPENINIILDNVNDEHYDKFKEKKHDKIKDFKYISLKIASIILIICFSGTILFTIYKNIDNKSTKSSNIQEEPIPTRAGSSCVELNSDYSEKGASEPQEDYLSVEDTNSENILLTNPLNNYQYLLKPNEEIIEANADGIITKTVPTDASIAFISNNMLVLIAPDESTNKTTIQCFFLSYYYLSYEIYNKTYDGLYTEYSLIDESNVVFTSKSNSPDINLTLTYDYFKNIQN